jgi:hypothetical protein
MPSRSSAAAIAILPSIAATLPHVGEQVPGTVVFKTEVAQSRSCPSCGRYMRAIPRASSFGMYIAAWLYGYRQLGVH